MKILAVEFSSEQRSVAIAEQLPETALRVRGVASEKGGRNTHAIALVEQALQEAKMEREEIDCIAVGIGPGSYTGIRAAIALAQGWQLARETNVIGVSSVECLAAQTWTNGFRGRASFIIDAQRSEFYLATYELNESGFNEIEPLHLTTFSEVERRIAGAQSVFGPGATISFGAAHDLFPDAAMLARLAAGKTKFVCGEKLEPIYLREISFVKAPPPRVISD